MYLIYRALMAIIITFVLWVLGARLGVFLFPDGTDLENLAIIPAVVGMFLGVNAGALVFRALK